MSFLTTKGPQKTKWTHSVSAEHCRTRSLAHDRRFWLVLSVQKTVPTVHCTEKTGKSHVVRPELLSGSSARPAAPSRWDGVTSLHLSHVLSPVLALTQSSEFRDKDQSIQ